MRDLGPGRIKRYCACLEMSYPVLLFSAYAWHEGVRSESFSLPDCLLCVPSRLHARGQVWVPNSDLPCDPGPVTQPSHFSPGKWERVDHTFQGR